MHKKPENTFIHLEKIGIRDLCLDVCITLDCFLNWFKEYSVVISVPLAVASFFTGWYFNKKKMDIDKANQHFKDIKDKVIGPILQILNKIESVQPEFVQFPSWREGSNSIFAKNPQGEKFLPLPEKVLFYDFSNNHYPELKKPGIRLKMNLILEISIINGSES